MKKYNKCVTLLLGTHFQPLLVENGAFRGLICLHKLWGEVDRKWNQGDKIKGVRWTTGRGTKGAGR